MISTRIGAHIIGGTNRPLMGNGIKPRCCKLVNVDTAYVRQVRGIVGPDCLIIVRWVVPQTCDNPLARANEWFSQHQAAMCAMADPMTAFEAWNEVADQDAAFYARFEVERLRLMHAAKLRSVVGNWSVGVPDLPVWGTYKPALDAMKTDDLVGLHEYWDNDADVGNHWHCARWSIPEVAAAIGQRGIVITECGQVAGKHTLAGFRAYDSLIAKYPQVLGACAFTLGTGGDPTWDTFATNLYNLWPQFVAEYNNAGKWTWQVPVVVPPPPPATPVYIPEKVTAPGVTYQDWYGSPNWCGRAGCKPTELVAHSTDKAPGATIEACKATFAHEDVSAHDIVAEDGHIVRVVGYDRAAWTVGGSTIPGVPGGSIDGTSIVNLRSINVELDHCWTPGAPWPEVQLAAAAAHMRAICERYGITRAHVWRHGDIDPQHRSDPRDIDGARWQAFLDRVFPPPPPVSPPTENLPHAETCTDAPTLAQKVRWWVEEALRCHEAGNDARAWAILYDCIKGDRALMYRLENALRK